ncbi:pentapeptide repeat-containing protein [Paenibacillus sp. MER 99-2]|uniref:pentapeptide repeat-containing protein n=1 Tax=Paenibacillus sp. MER 99-2 TaxID=2939572 RepID=UPI002041762F|nr:pentapeptide repeat-containing protein [Paenibacillus sp. MER 99-2]MCM3170792.1 pentapeptide repeat-containing protein [Paenibacillus sp. MER 99-2]
MNKEEALTHFNQVVLEPAIHYALSTLRTYVVEHREELIQAFVESIRQLCIQAKMDQEQQGKSSVAFIHCSMLRMSLVNGSYAYLLEAYSEDWYWDSIGCFHEYDATWAFAPLNELQDSLIVEMKRYGGKLNASDAERMILQAAGQFNAFVMTIARMAVPHILNLPEMQALDRSDRFQIRVGEYKDYSEPVHIREGDHRNIQHLRKKISTADGLENAYGDYTSLSLPEGSFDHVDVRYSDFSDADFRKCSFINSVLIGTKWHRSNLSETDLRGSVLTDASFRGCNLKGANLSETSDGGNGDGFATTSLGLQGISFERANLENADLRGANLAQADFKEANLTGAQVWIHDRDKYEDQWSDKQLASVLWVALPTREDKEGLWSSNITN